MDAKFLKLEAGQRFSRHSIVANWTKWNNRGDFVFKVRTMVTPCGIGRRRCGDVIAPFRDEVEREGEGKKEKKT
jgi:hypothetical protein